MHHIYLGYYGVSNNQQGVYCNFYPMFEYDDNKFIDVRDAIKEEYAHGSIAIFYTNSFEQQEQFLKDGEYCVIEFFDGDIYQYSTNSQGLTKYKCYLEDLFNNGQVHTLSEYDVYPIVTAESDDIDFSKIDIITIKESFPIKYSMKKVLLQNNNAYYGPFDVDLRIRDQKRYINTHIKENNYLITEIDENNIPRDLDSILPLPYRFGYDLYLKYKQAKPIPIDVITEEIIENCIQSESDTCFNQQTILHNLPDEILEKRKNKISQTIQNLENSNYVSNLLYNKTLSVLSSSDSDAQKQELIEVIFSHPDAILKLQSSKIVMEKIDEIKKELDLLERQRDELKLHAKEIEEEELLGKSRELQKLCDNIEIKNKELQELAKKLFLTTEIDKLQTKVAEVKKEYQAVTECKLEVEKEAQNAIREAQHSFATAVKNSLDKKLLLSINDILNEEKSIEEDQSYDAVVNHINKETIFCNKKGLDLINYIVAEVQKHRPDYDYNFIVNILISIRQNFITFFSGPPGTGKTSICNIIANILGLNNPSLYPPNLTKGITCTAFTAVSVERGWNTKKDFIGYYNPLTKNIEKNNSDIIDLLKISGKNTENSLPAFILLDEANLSPLEYYWSDFVGISDDINNPCRTIDLGNGYKLKIAPPVRFLATMNSDHTVEKLSPRIIDRTAFITLPQPKKFVFDMEIKQNVYPPVNWNDFYNALSHTNTQFLSAEENIFSEFKALFNKINSPITPRTEKNIRNYCLAARELFRDENGIQSEIVAIDYAILQKILPKISWSGSEYKKVLEELLDLCKKNGLYMSENMLSKILINGNESLINSYDYFM